MSEFPRSPRLMRGALVRVHPFDPIGKAVIFQYNPASMTRSLSLRDSSDSSEGAGSGTITNAPTETIKLDIEMDATDQLDAGDGVAGRHGLYPQLSALELMLYPPTGWVIAKTVMAMVGTIELIPPPEPLTLFIWGPKRVLPVKVTSVSIQEEAYDPNLNPIRADVSLSLQVLSYSDLSVTDPGYYLFLAHQVTKEAMAAIGMYAHPGAG